MEAVYKLYRAGTNSLRRHRPKARATPAHLATAAAAWTVCSSNAQVSGLCLATNWHTAASSVWRAPTPPLSPHLLGPTGGEDSAAARERNCVNCSASCSGLGAAATPAFMACVCVHGWQHLGVCDCV